MTPSWILENIALSLTPPFRGWAGMRSPENLIKVVHQFEVETAERYRKRDLDGKPGDETTCNIFAADVTDALGCPLPRRVLANVIHDWLCGPVASSQGWMKVGSKEEAAELANQGYPVVVAWRNLDGRPGHLAIGVPSTDPGLHIAQSGSTNFSCRPLSSGFGMRQVKLFTHT